MKNLKVISAIGSFLAQSRSIKKGAKAVVYHNEQKMKFSGFLQEISSNLQENVDLVTFTEEIINGKRHFLSCASEFCKIFESSNFLEQSLTAVSDFIKRVQSQQ